MRNAQMSKKARPSAEDGDSRADEGSGGGRAWMEARRSRHAKEEARTMEAEAGQRRRWMDLSPQRFASCDDDICDGGVTATNYTVPAEAEEEGGWGHGFVALWEVPPQLDTRGNLPRRKGRVGGSSYAASLPIGNVP
jgi:hypothetical protein